jgi:BirA family biotin operon repressor/biotin-[acetyl-CoA-carboxylase] ligase
LKTRGLETFTWAQAKGIPVSFFPTVSSTSTYAKNQLDEITKNQNDLFLVLADSQEQGRGRGRHTWTNPAPGASLLSTWVFRLKNPPQPTLSPRVGLGLYRTLKNVWPEASFSLKAPNDLYLGEKKLAGLLLEAVEQGTEIRLLIGLGMNIDQSPSLESATCLRQALEGPQIDSRWILFLDALLSEFQQTCLNTNPDLSIEEADQLLIALNQFPLLKRAYTKVEKDGSLCQGKTTTAWWDL